MYYRQVGGPSASISCKILIFNQNRRSCFVRVDPSFVKDFLAILAFVSLLKPFTVLCIK